MAKEIHVFVELVGAVHQVGNLWLHKRQGVERASFRYSTRWLSAPNRFPLEPSLPLGEGVYHTDKSLFGCMSDAAPDRWGRMLMDRMESREAVREGRQARKLSDSDYLLMVDDRARQGALRFATDPNGPFLSCRQDMRIPPMVELGKLLRGSRKVVNQEEKDQDLQDIWAPGSSLGGARPKASVVDSEGALWIAKFPSPKDDWDVELWEAVALHLAKKISLPVPDFQLRRISGANILLTKRFDRRAARRIPFISAMTMLNARDMEPASYLEIAEAIIAHGAAAEADLKGLWRRMVFNVLISNLDDHLRNHGFLYDGKLSGWRLSPIYDLEPLPEGAKARFLQTAIAPGNNTASLDPAFEVAEEFGLPPREARSLARETGRITGSWRKEASRFGASKREIDFMASAFENDNLRLALGGGNVADKKNGVFSKSQKV